MDEIIKNLQKIAVDIALTLAIGISLAFVTHWLLGEEYASRQQAKILSPIAGYLYGISHRDEISVLLIDDSSLKKVGMSWPTRYSYEARLLRSIGRHHPKSIFLDIYFKEQRESSDIGSLVKSICDLKNEGINVFLGATKDKNENFSLRSELEEKTNSCFKKVALYYAPDEIDKTAWSYPVYSYSSKQSQGEVINSAAVELYNDYKHQKLEQKTRDSNLALTWGSMQASHGIAWNEQEKDLSYSSNSYCRKFQGISELIPGALRKYGLKNHEKPICVFHETLLAQDLSTNSTEEENYVDRRIRGKIVMIGVAISDSRDFVLSPLHGKIPGVYLHAMALDNLLKYGSDYPEEVSLTFKKNSSQLHLLLFLIISIIVLYLLKPIVFSLIERSANSRNKLFDSLFRLSFRNKILNKFFFMCITFLYISIKILEKLFAIIAVTALTGVIALFGSELLNIGFISTFSISMFVIGAEWLEIKEKVIEKFSFPHETNPKDVLL